MSVHWGEVLQIDPISVLLSWDDPALAYYVQRDLLEKEAISIERLWELLPPQKLIKKQSADGSWRYPGKTIHPESGTNYFLLQTYRNLRVLVEMYGLQRDHPTMSRAAEFVFSCQTEEGDIRGLLGSQYMPYYHGAILELLIKAGYADDARTIKGLEWLLAVRQDDGGWVVPVQTVPHKQKTSAFWLGDPVVVDKTKPSSHMATGMALRAFAAHPSFRQHPDAIAAGKLLRDRLFKADKYGGRKAPSYWLKFQYPFWWASLLTALDTLSQLGFKRRDEPISKGLEWFLSNQAQDGLWETGYGIGARSAENRHWVGLAICRVLKSYLM